MPDAAGVYLIKGAGDKILYVGKAKNLKKRVSSYFRRGVYGKTFHLMSAAKKIEYIITPSENQAEVLEEKLIKLIMPKYNVIMRDDKNYPYVSLTTEKYPRLEFSRGRRTSNCFGPYPDAGALRISMRNIKRIFGLPLCTRQQYSGIKKTGQPERCLYFEIEKCSAPCCGRISVGEYRGRVKNAVSFLQGGRASVLKKLRADMKNAAAKHNYERALRLKNSIEAFENIARGVGVAEIDGSKYLFEPSRAADELQTILELRKKPLVIDGLDISHTQGSFPAASAVRFKNGRPDKSGYRKYSVRFKGIDDCAMLREVVRRRYKDYSADLILVDGGAGQVSSVAGALSEMGRDIEALGLAKREELIYREKGAPVKLFRDSPALRLLMYIRDESHRFARAFHLLRRRKQFLSAGFPNPDTLRGVRPDKVGRADPDRHRD